MGHRQCPNCGAYLDPGERCDCRDSEQPQEEEDNKKAMMPASTAAIP